MLAALLSLPELRINDDEAKRLASALAEVNRHYQLPVISPKHMALATLAWTAGSIYVPRALAISGHSPTPRPVPRPEPPVTGAVTPTGDAAGTNGAGASPMPAGSWFAPETVN